MAERPAVAPTLALVVGNGEPPSRQLFEQLLDTRPALLLCADGGANVVRRYGREPDYIVGDLDSVAADVVDGVPGHRTVRVDADNTGTDLGKVLRHAIHLGITEAVLTGVTGRRTDHTLWNLSLLRTFAGRLRLRIFDDDCHIQLIDRRVRFRAPLGQFLSLSPLDGPVGDVWTEGLRWPLAGEALVSGERDGISNEVESSPVSIRVGSGDLLLILHRVHDRAGTADEVEFLPVDGG